jgi:RNase adapter protein RapZ
MPFQKETHLVVITGLSGGGKTVALRALEDFGFYAIDNLPISLTSPLLNEVLARGIHRIAVSVDVRTAGAITQLRDELNKLIASAANPTANSDASKSHVRLSVLYLTATLEAVTRRFGESRRPHPLAGRLGSDATSSLRANLGNTSSTGELVAQHLGEASLEACMRAEQTLLSPLRDIALEIDTSHLNAVQLRSRIRDWLDVESVGTALLIQSFGFKRGVPLDADFVFDARFLANPYYDTNLRELSGRDQPVIDFLTRDDDAVNFAESTAQFIKQWLPRFAKEGRAAIGLAIGCTGGQHRSVFVAEQIAQRLAGATVPGVNGLAVRVRHRDAKLA